MFCIAATNSQGQVQAACWNPLLCVILAQDSWGSAASAIMTRPNSGGVCERRGCAASDNCRGFVDQPVVLKGLYHESGVVHAARHIALEDGISRRRI